MTWFGYLIISWWVVNAALVASQVGKPRKPLDPGAAAFTVIIDALLIWGVLTVGTNP